MQQEYHTLKKEYEEARKKVVRYQEDLKEEDERVKRRDSSLFQVEKEKKLTQTLLERARDDLGKAQEAVREFDLACSATVQAQKDVEG